MLAAIIPSRSPEGKPIATWGQRVIVHHRPHVYLVDPAGCTCGQAACPHQAAVRALGERRGHCLERVVPSRPPRPCPNCGQRTLEQLAGSLLALTVCSHCGFSHVVYAPVPHHSGNGRHRHAVTAVRGR